MEIGESNGASSGRVRVSGNSLQLAGAATGGTNFGLSREVDLSTATQATLTFDYRVDDDIGGGGTTRIEISDNGGSTWTTLQTYDLNVFAGWTSQSFDISAYIAADTQVRLIGTGNNNNVFFYADDVQIQYQTSGDVFYEGVLIGTATGGQPGNDLVVTFNASATPAAVTELARNVSYENTDTATPTLGPRATETHRAAQCSE